MSEMFDYKAYKTLFVDDESQALKYFTKACAKDFDVLTAQSVDEAAEIIAREGNRIGVVITDQRMPDKTGVDLLVLARRDIPEAVRILTTAYSDLDSAIDAVNDGAIYQYIPKPWDVRALRGILMRAMERFLVGRHRDELMGEKLSVIQQALLQDRARALIAIAEALSDRSAHAVLATRAYIDAAPKRPAPAKPSTPMDPLPLIAASSRGLIALAGTLRERLKTTGAAAAVNLKELLPQAQGEATIKAERSRLENAVAGLASLAVNPSDIRIETTEAGAQISWPCPQTELANLFTALTAIEPTVADAGALIAWLGIYHHGGSIALRDNQLVASLPAEPATITSPDDRPDWMERLIERYEF